jgi:hypothetical protein
MIQQSHSWGYTQRDVTQVTLEAPSLIFIATQFTLAKLWKKPRYPTMDEWIKKILHLNTMEFYSAMKQNEILPFSSK